MRQCKALLHISASGSRCRWPTDVDPPTEAIVCLCAARFQAMAVQKISVWHTAITTFFLFVVDVVQRETVHQRETPRGVFPLARLSFAYTHTHTPAFRNEAESKAAQLTQAHRRRARVKRSEGHYEHKTLGSQLPILKLAALLFYFASRFSFPFTDD